MIYQALLVRIVDCEFFPKSKKSYSVRLLLRSQCNMNDTQGKYERYRYITIRKSSKFSLIPHKHTVHQRETVASDCIILQVRKPPTKISRNYPEMKCKILLFCWNWGIACSNIGIWVNALGSYLGIVERISKAIFTELVNKVEPVGWLVVYIVYCVSLWRCWVSTLSKVSNCDQCRHQLITSALNPLVKQALGTGASFSPAHSIPLHAAHFPNIVAPLLLRKPQFIQLLPLL